MVKCLECKTIVHLECKDLIPVNCTLDQNKIDALNVSIFLPSINYLSSILFFFFISFKSCIFNSVVFRH